MSYTKHSKTVSVLLLVTAALLFSIMAVQVKLLSGDLPSQLIVFCRFITSIPLCLIILYNDRKKESFRIKRKWSLLLRGIFGAAAMLCYFIAIEKAGSGVSTLLLNTFPIWVVLYSFVIFKTKSTVSEMSAVVLCFIGVAFVFKDKINNFSLQQAGSIGVILALIAGSLRGWAMIFVKRSGSRNHPAMVYLSVCLAGLLITPFIWRDIHLIFNTAYLPHLLIIIGSAFIGQMLLAVGMRGLTATVSSLIIYSGIPITLLLSLMIGETLSLPAWFGVVLILGALILPFVKRSKAEMDD